MRFEVPCACGRKLTVSAGAAGVDVRCECGHAVEVPDLRTLWTLPRSPEPLPKQAWRVVETFGPAFSHGGFQNWQICVCLDGIVAVPLGIWPTVAAGVAAGAGYVTISMTHGAAAGTRLMTDEGDSSWRRYPLYDLQSVRVKKPFLGFLGAPELYVHRRGEREPDLYGVPKV
jgi:hypothetical protein